MNKIIANTVEREGGYVNHEDDRGGATKYGITERVARQYGYEGDMRDLPLETAVEIYKKRYWDPIKLDDFNDPVIKELMFDASINHGHKWAVRFAQRAYNVLNREEITEDGLVGPETINAVNSYNHKKDLSFWYLVVRGRYFYDIVQNDKSQKSFIRGWGRRLQGLLTEVL